MNANDEVMALAVADGPPPVARSVCIDDSHDLEIGRCGTRLRLLVAASFAMTLFSASLAFNWWGGLSQYDSAMGYAGLAVFGSITCGLIWMLPGKRKPVVIVTPYGIRDLRIGNEFLPWDSIADVSAGKCRGHDAIVLTPTPALSRQLACLRFASRAAQSDRIAIQSDGLTADFKTLLQACRDCHATSDPRTAMQQEDERGTPGFSALAS